MVKKQRKNLGDRTQPSAGTPDAGTGIGKDDATHSPTNIWWPTAAESKIEVTFGRPYDFYMTLPEGLASVRGHLVRRLEPILLHPCLEEHVLEWQPSRNVVLRLSVDPLGRVYVNPLYTGDDDRDNAEYAEIVKASESEWVKTHKTDDPYFFYGARSVKRLRPPKWPSESFEAILRMALQGRIISDPAHPAIQSFMAPKSKAKLGERGFRGIRQLIPPVT